MCVTKVDGAREGGAKGALELLTTLYKFEHFNLDRLFTKIGQSERGCRKNSKKSVSMIHVRRPAIGRPDMSGHPLRATVDTDTI